MSRVRVEEWLRWFAKFTNPFGGVDGRGEEWYFDFAPGSLKVAVGLFCFFVFLQKPFCIMFDCRHIVGIILLCRVCPNHACMQLFLVS